LGRAFNGHRADYHQFLCAPMFGRIASIDADIADGEQISARLAPFMWKAILDTRVLIAEDLGAAQQWNATIRTPRGVGRLFDSLMLWA
jgi:hypothetical protein